VKFKLSDKFIDQYKNRLIPLGECGEFVYYRTYSRLIVDDSGFERNEHWHETVRRVVEGTFQIQKDHVKKFKLPWNNDKAQKSAKIMFDKIFNFKFLPPGRGLWMMGTDFIEKKGSAALNNCGFISTDDIDIRGSFAFTWAMDALMLGVGIGFDTRGEGKVKIQQPDFNDEVFVIPDNREGWVESVRIIIDAYFTGNCLPEFDYDDIRPKGEPIKGFGGTASGYEPLKKLHDRLYKLFRDRVGKTLSSVDIVDILNMIAVCVISGNVRRSAQIALGEYDDINFHSMKCDIDKVMAYRHASNNSVFVKSGQYYSDIIDSIISNGEPGLVWLDNMRKYGRFDDGLVDYDNRLMGVNPCGEQGLESAELCCLVEVYPSLHNSNEEFIETLKYAYMYAKSVTLLPTHWEETNAIMLKNRRIGTSVTGITDSFAKHGRRDMLYWFNSGYKYLNHIDNIYSDWLCEYAPGHLLY